MMANRVGRLDSGASWLVVGAALLATFSAFGVVYSFGVALDSIRDEFGIGTGVTSLLFAISTLIYFVLGVFTGRLADRHGPRRVLLVGAASMGAGLWLTSLADNLWLAAGTYGFGVGIAVACAYVPMVSAVGAWFERYRTAALGVAVAGIGLGQLVAAPTVKELIERYGWRDTYQALAVVASGLLLVAALAARRPPDAPPASELPSMRRLAHNRRFSLLYLSMFLLSASLFIPIVYIDNYVSDRGGTQGAWLISVIGLASVVGRLGLAALGSVLPLMRLYQICFTIMGLSYLIWLFAGESYAILTAYAVVMGASYGGFIALSPAVAAQLFGLAGLGGVLGALYTAAGFGGLVGPPLVGLLIDNAGYRVAMVVSMIVALASVPFLVAAARARAVPLATIGDGEQTASSSEPKAALAPTSSPVTNSQTPTPAQPLARPQPLIPVGGSAALGPARIDSVLLLSFGGPDGPDDVVPFLENVTQGRDIPAARLAQVEANYLRHGGVSPINEHSRSLLGAVSKELSRRGTTLPCYWGNRNWHPYLTETVGQMAAEGRRHAAVIVTSAFSSYSGCRQYHEDLAAAVEATPGAPRLCRVRVYGNHPGFVEAAAERVREAIVGARLSSNVHTLFTAHSLPNRMAAACDYELQLRDTADAVAKIAGLDGDTEVVYQSRSGPPQVPWLEPDINDRLRELGAQGCRTVLVAPLGFVSDHMEVLVDLDTAARATAARAGITMVRAHSVGTHPRFVEGLVNLVEETAGLRSERPTSGQLGPRPDTCAPGCCPQGQQGR